MRTYLAATLALFSLTAEAQHFTQTNLLADVQAANELTDPNLVNPWGMCRGTGTPWWISDNGTGLSTLYDATGTAQSLVVAIPQGAPSGCIYNGTGGFLLANGKSALFLFSSESGVISGWSPGATEATVVWSNPSAVYKGLAIASFGGANYLYAVDFHNARVDIFDTNFQLLRASRPGITDSWFSNYPGGPGYAPYNIRNIGGNLIMAIALQDGAKHDNVNGPGLGYIASFTPQGQLIRTFEHNAWLNGPWGLAQAPGDFGAFSHTLLVGNFGSGQIISYNLETGMANGLMLDASGNPISIDGLWGLSFGAGDTKSGPANTLYFTAGTNDENDGLFGTLTAASTDLTLGSGN